MRQLGSWLEKIGGALAMIGGLCFAGIFAIVLVNGSWPDFLEPVRSRYTAISQIAGSLTFIVELLIFVSPGLVMAAAGRKLQNSN